MGLEKGRGTRDQIASIRWIIEKSCRAQEGRRCSEEAVPGPSVFPSGVPGVSGDFWGSQQNNKVNGNGIILISNHLKRKWVECPNQKTKTG